MLIYPSVTFLTASTCTGGLQYRSDAVLVGVNTLLLDNPQLNARDVLPGVPTPPQQQQPRSVILDSTLRFCRGSTTSLRVQVRAIILYCHSPQNPIIMTLTPIPLPPVM